MQPELVSSLSTDEEIVEYEKRAFGSQSCHVSCSQLIRACFENSLFNCSLSCPPSSETPLLLCCIFVLRSIFEAVSSSGQTVSSSGQTARSPCIFVIRSIFEAVSSSGQTGVSSSGQTVSSSGQTARSLCVFSSSALFSKLSALRGRQSRLSQMMMTQISQIGERLTVELNLI